MATRIGVDVGGTFTDLVWYDEDTGRTRVAKGATTSHHPDAGVLAVVGDAVPQETLRRAAYFLHGTTVGLNALLEREGAVVGLLATQGFRDTLELRRGRRERQYDLYYQPSPALVPRRLRIGIEERILADGTTERPFSTEDLRTALERFRAEKVESIAVCFLNSYAHPRHELEAEKELRRLGFDGSITLSHRLSRELREFERTSTSVIDAYVRPVMSRYLCRLDDALRVDGFTGDSLITRSGGGSLSFEEAQQRPFETVMSGPVAGAVGAARLGRALGLARALTADVGGTSFDTCLLVDGSPVVKYEGNVADLPVQTPWVDVRSIGSGGGSIAYVETGSLLRVGPDSSGADPGPVCYGRGGRRPTTTDAAAVLGMLAFGELASGLRLDISAARDAIEELGAALGLTVDEAASGVISIAGAAMAGAVRSLTIEQGEDPRDAALISFGGAGPMLATLIAGELDIRTIVVPEHAGNFSAYGLLGQDVTRSTSATLVRQLDAEGVAAAHARVAELRAELESRVPSGRDESAAQVLEAALELRYLGQYHTLTVPWQDPADADPARLVKAFESRYEKIFGGTFDGPVEIVAVRVTLREPLAEFNTDAAEDDRAAVAADRVCEAYSFELGRRTEFVVRDRSALGEQACEGPMIILEPTATTYLDAGWTVRVGPRAALLISRRETV